MKLQDSEEIAVKANREVVDTLRQDSFCYRLERIRCGREKCRCARGQLHGPYWYVYYRENGRLKSEYLGRMLPPFHPALTEYSDRLHRRNEEERKKIRSLVEESQLLRLQSGLHRAKLKRLSVDQRTYDWHDIPPT